MADRPGGVGRRLARRWTSADAPGPVAGLVRAVQRYRGQRVAESAHRRRDDLTRRIHHDSPVGIVEADVAGRITFVNEALCRMVGRPASAIVGTTVPDLMDPAFRDAAEESFRVEVPRGATYTAERRYRHADGSSIPVLVSTAPLRDTRGQVHGVVGFAIDMSEQHAQREALQEAQRRLSQAALQDPLTGLANRVVLERHLAEAIEAAADGGEVAVLFVDLDGFKRVNDIAGHAAGDALLVQCGIRLRALVREHDTVARVGGDEFVVVLHPHGEDDVRATAVDVAQRIREALREAVVVDGQAHAVTASIGISYAGGRAAPAQVLRDADAAMYRAKAQGKNHYEIFTDLLREDRSERRAIEHRLRAALCGEDHDHDCPVVGADHCPRLAVALQPAYRLGTGDVAAVEAVVRLVDGTGTTAADDLVGVAEDAGLIDQVGRFVLDDALARVAAWRAEGTLPDYVRVSVNLSARELHGADLADDVLAALDRHGVPPTALALELREAVVAVAGAGALAQLGRLRDHGVAVVIDDLGVGTTDLRGLATLPLAGVKVDRRLTAGLPDDPTARAVVRALIGLADSLGLECTLTGIERPEQLHGLPDHVVVQGLLTGAPATPDDLRLTLRETADGSQKPLIPR